jgi:hypothetical protein
MPNLPRSLPVDGDLPSCGTHARESEGEKRSLAAGSSARERHAAQLLICAHVW